MIIISTVQKFQFLSCMRHKKWTATLEQARLAMIEKKFKKKNDGVYFMRQ